ncbi:MAG: hypothetical protein HYY18_00505 [Planctomycetes bacterium]|nr:hypothetical protein [Planctomycetota bacterium]
MRKAIPLVFAFALCAATEDAPVGPHGGSWLELPGAAAKFEVVYEKERKRAVAYAFEPDGKTPAQLKTAPELKLDALDDKAPLSGKALNVKEGAAHEFEFEREPEEKPAGDPPPNSGPHGGMWLDIASHSALLELKHEQALGRATIWVMDKDGETPFGLKESPVFNLDGFEGPVQIPGKAIGLKEGLASRFEYESPDLKVGPPGLASRIVLRIDGKQYNAPMINREHGHSHGPKK